MSAMVEEFAIRLAVREEMPAIMKLIQKLATFEKYPDGPKINSEDLVRDAFDSKHAWFFVLIAVNPAGHIAGYAMCHRAYSSWLGRAMYMEDFYVEPDLRGHGIGHRLFKELCKMALLEGVQQIDWHVLVNNKIAIDFYEQHGAYDLVKQEDRTAYRIKVAAIEAVANSTQ